MEVRDDTTAQSTLPTLSAAEQSLVDDLVADGLAIQSKFRPEPLYKQTGRGHFEGNTVEEIQDARRDRTKEDMP